MTYTKMEGIRARRVALGLSVADAADAIGVTRQAWNNWERGAAIPFTPVLPDLARVLKCSIEDLYTAPEDGGPPTENE